MRERITHFQSFDAKTMIKRHTQIIADQNKMPGRLTKKELNKVAKEVVMSDHEKEVMKTNPKYRLSENREERERLYQDSLIDNYIRMYTNLTKQMVVDYKKKAINAFLTGQYCGSDNGTAQSKYSDKHRELIEQALYGDMNWHKLKSLLVKKADSDLDQIKLSAPLAVKNAAIQIHKEFCQFVTVKDLDQNTDQLILTIFGGEVEDISDQEE